MLHDILYADGELRKQSEQKCQRNGGIVLHFAPLYIYREKKS